MSSKLDVFKKHLEAIGTAAKYLLGKSRMTQMYPEVSQTLPREYRAMIRLILEKCISCTLCARICPADAIKMYVFKDRRHPGISFLRCVFCGFCVDICPSDALQFTDVHDAAYYTREEMILPPESFVKAPQLTPLRKPPKMVEPQLDSEKGIRYERI